MVRCAVILVALMSFTAQDNAVKQEREKLQGKWKLVSTEEKGKKAAAVGNVVVVIDGDNWVIEIENQFKKIKGNMDKVSMTFKIDPTQDPKSIDLIRTIGEKKFVDKNIYKLDKDTLTVRTRIPGSREDRERPKKFETVEGGRIDVYKRVEK
jgi:uncharacterized protein (TIGR03067 family)